MTLPGTANRQDRSCIVEIGHTVLHKHTSGKTKHIIDKSRRRKSTQRRRERQAEGRDRPPSRMKIQIQNIRNEAPTAKRGREAPR